MWSHEIQNIPSLSPRKAEISHGQIQKKGKKGEVLLCSFTYIRENLGLYKIYGSILDISPPLRKKEAP